MSDEASFERFSYGDELAYVGPASFDGDWRAPRDHWGPFTFCHVTHFGTLGLETRFNAPRSLAPEHPANDAAYWEAADEQ